MKRANKMLGSAGNVDSVIEQLPKRLVMITSCCH